GGRTRPASATRSSKFAIHTRALRDHTKAAAHGTVSKAPGTGPTEFWSRFAELERQGLISPDLRTAPQVKQVRPDGDWSHLFTWLEDQVGQ
ncbi:MAG: hypothetical protein P8Y03_27685, partial [Anaerolineales bacterium]